MGFFNRPEPQKSNKVYVVYDRLDRGVLCVHTDKQIADEIAAALNVKRYGLPKSFIYAQEVVLDKLPKERLYASTGD